MSIHDLGYRPWQGRRLPSWTLTWTIAQTGAMTIWKSAWLRRLCLAAWLPTIYFGIGFFMFEQAVDSPDSRLAVAGFIRTLPHGDFVDLSPQRLADPDYIPQLRHDVWTMMLHTLFRYPQAIVLVLLMGLIAPPLIARDLRSRAHLIYFARPLNFTEYLLGKSAVVGFFMLIVTALPALTLYFVGIMLSADVSVVQSTWDIPLRILLASLVLLIPTTSLALGISSLTKHSRFVSFIWFAIWILGWVAYANLAFASQMTGTDPDRWNLVSLYHVLGDVQGWVFGITPQFHDVLPSAVLLLAITVLFVPVLYRRVSAPLRV